MRFHVLVLTLNHKSVFSRSDDVTSPHLLLRDVTLLLILIENIVLVVPQEKLSFTIVSITFLWVQSKKTSFWGSDDIVMMSQAPRPKLWLGTGSFLLSDTQGTIISSQTFLRKKRPQIWNSDLSIPICTNVFTILRCPQFGGWVRIGKF